MATVPTRVENELCSDDATFSEVLRETVAVLEGANIPYLLIGGIASTGHGRQRWTHDIDVLVRPDDGERAHTPVAGAGDGTEKTDPHTH